MGSGSVAAFNFVKFSLVYFLQVKSLIDQQVITGAHFRIVLRFVPPITHIVLIESVDCKIFNLKSAKVQLGHRADGNGIFFVIKSIQNDTNQFGFTGA